MIRNRRLYESIMKDVAKIVKSHLNEGTNLNKYNYFPKTKKELKNIIKQKIQDEGPNANLNDINVSEITDMSYLFARIPNVGNIHIEDWDVSNVENMKCMFWNCENFNSDLSQWDVNNVKDMSYMFEFCKKFNSDLSQWDVNNVENMSSMFYNCRNFNSDLSRWDVSNVEIMNYIFYNCVKFNGDLSNWDVSNVQNMNGIFHNTKLEKIGNLPSWLKNDVLQM